MNIWFSQSLAIEVDPQPPSHRGLDALVGHRTQGRVDAEGPAAGRLGESGAFEFPGDDRGPCGSVRLEAAQAAGNQFAAAAGCPAALLGDALSLLCLRLIDDFSADHRCDLWDSL